MLHSKFIRTIARGIAVFTLLTALFIAGCGGRGDTDGGPGNDSAGIGTQYVSDGGAGSTLSIALRGGATTIRVTEITGFSVTAIDPNGLPLPFIRINCDTEHGLSIIEPSDGGLAFEHTNQDGFMSGLIGGLTPGSFILECRGPQGFNLVDCISIIVLGDVPDDFEGWSGAAGGNLGGGVLIESPEEEELEEDELSEDELDDDDLE